MTFPQTWSHSSHTHEGITHPTYRKGTGPGVIVIHEIPGITPAVSSFAQEVVSAGYTVVMPSLFGVDGAAMTPLSVGKAFGQVCISREFTKLRNGVTTPVAGWLRSLARDLHADVGGPGVGALGMCLTGGYALAMMVDAPVTAPVLCQPSTPFAFSPSHRADVNLSPGDLDIVKGKCARGQQVLGLRFKSDPMVGTRFDTLTRELGDAFIRVEFEGWGHSTVTEQRQQEGVDAVLSFFAANLS